MRVGGFMRSCHPSMGAGAVAVPKGCATGGRKGVPSAGISSAKTA